MKKKLVLALLALASLGLLGASLQPQPYTVDAYFLTVDGVVPGNDVVVSGLPVGHVTRVALAPEDQTGAVVTMEIERQYAPLRQGTRAVIRQKGLLGTMIIELQPGAAGNQAIRSGGGIPLSDTASPVTLDQINDIFDPATREKVKTLTLEGGRTFNGAGTDVNQVLQKLPAVSADAADVSGRLSARDQELDALAVEFDRVAGMMAAEDQSLRGDLRNGASLFKVLATHQQKLQDEVVYANSALGRFNAALGGHEKDLNALLKQMPGLEDDLQRFNEESATGIGYISPCMGDIEKTIAEMQSATHYRPSADANGRMMLRTETLIGGPSNGSYDYAWLYGTYRCGGAVP